MTEGSRERPIGYWLKELDRLIDTEFDRRLAAHQVTRRQWQVLNLLARGDQSRTAVAEELAPFLAGAVDDLDVALAGLAERQWLAAEHDRLSLTEQGRAALAELREAVGEIRSTSTRDVSPEDYQTTITVLATMVRNLQ